MWLLTFLSSHQGPYTTQGFGQRLCETARLKRTIAYKHPYHRGTSNATRREVLLCLPLLVTLSITSSILRENALTNSTNWTKEVTQHDSNTTATFSRRVLASSVTFLFHWFWVLRFPKNIIGWALFLLFLWLTIAWIAADVNVLIGIHGKMTLLYSAIIKAQFKPAFQFLCKRRGKSSGSWPLWSIQTINDRA